MDYRANKAFVDVLDVPGGAVVDTLVMNQEVTATGAIREVAGHGALDGIYREIVPQGWALDADLDSINEVVDPRLFVRECVTIERAANGESVFSPWFIAAEFIIARALIETNLTNVPPQVPGTSPGGPLQVTPQEWTTFLNAVGDFAAGFRPEGYSDWLRQTWAASLRMHADAKAIAAVRQQQGTDPANNAYVATHLDLLHAYLLNSPEAVVAIIKAKNADADKDKPLDKVLDGVLDQQKINAAFAGRERFFGTPAAPKTLSQFLAATQAALTQALNAANDLIKQHAPEVVEKPVDPPPVITIETHVPTDVVSTFAGQQVAFGKLNTPVNECFWPVITKDPLAMVVCYENTAGHIIGPNPGRRFFADRRGGARHHVGLDVFCREGDVTVACANGKIVNYYAFYRDSHGVMSFALFIAHDGVVCNYGEVKGNAPNEFGWRVGDTVTAGQKIARVSGTNMIHFETYEPGTTTNTRWLRGESKPPRLQNPTTVLLNLAAGAKRITIDGQTSQTSQASHTSQTSQTSQTSGNAKPATKTGVPLSDNDLLTLARTIYGEARDQSPDGRAAVGHVVVNRLLSRRFRNTIADVCQQRLQFSCWNADDPNRPKIVSILPGANKVFDQCVDTAAQVLHAQLQDNTGGATHYYATYIRAPNWTRPPSQFTTQIGVHKFYTHVA